MRTEKLIKVSWRKPSLLIDSHEYVVAISNMATALKKNVTVAGNQFHYLFAPSMKEDYCALLEICVMSLLLPSNRVGGVSGCVTTSLKRGRHCVALQLTV